METISSESARRETPYNNPVDDFRRPGGSDQPASTTLNLHETIAPLAPDLAGAGFHAVRERAVVGDQVAVTYTVQNRGGLATPASGFNINFRLSADNHFDATDTDLGTDRVTTALAAGGSITRTFMANLPSIRGGQRLCRNADRSGG